MLTFSSAKRSIAARQIAGVAGAAAVLSVLVLNTAHADALWIGGCTGGFASVNCVLRKGEGGDPFIRTVPEPQTDADKQRAAERDRKWLARCRPVIEQDRYGVPRYEYFARGCEFGITE